MVSRLVIIQFCDCDRLWRVAEIICQTKFKIDIAIQTTVWLFFDYGYLSKGLQKQTTLYFKINFHTQLSTRTVYSKISTNYILPLKDMVMQYSKYSICNVSVTVAPSVTPSVLTVRNLTI